MNLLFVCVLGFMGRVCYKAMISYQTGADMLYENNMLGIHILRILSETEKMAIINQAILAFFTKYEANESAIITSVTSQDIAVLLDNTAVLKTKQEIAQAVDVYMKQNHLSFESYPSLQQGQAANV